MPKSPFDGKSKKYPAGWGNGSFSVDDIGRPRWDKDTKSVAEYEYHHADGTYAYSVEKGSHKDGEKRFRIWRQNMLRYSWRLEPEDRPERLWGLDGEPLIPYRLPELIEAAKTPGAPVLIPEGEKDVDTAVSLGLTATCNPCGALKWRAEFSPYLAGCDVVILVDNDDKGRQHAAKVARYVEPFAKRVRVLGLPDLPESGDLSDWVEQRRKAKKSDDAIKAELVTLIEGSLEAATWISQSGQMQRDTDGKVLRTQGNIRSAMVVIGVTVRYDSFEHRMMIDGLADFGPVLDDAAMTHLYLEIDKRFGFRPAPDFFWKVVENTARVNSFHPVKNYLESLKWDGVERIDSWLTTYGGAEKSDYTSTVGRITLIAAVRRIRQPGVKFDEITVFESPQGTNKSTALSTLAVRENWFSDDLPLNADSKTVIERTSGRWIIEAAELTGMRKGDIEHLKSLLSRRIDRSRMSYQRLVEERPRQCIFVGTTNSDKYLRDSTGNRRFWPVKIEKFDLEALARDRDQLWAEAAAREAEGASIRLPQELWPAAANVQEERQIIDPFEAAIGDAIGSFEGNLKIRAKDIWTILGDLKIHARTPEHDRRMGEAMQALGWKRTKLRFGGPSEWAYVKGSGPVRKRVEPMTMPGGEGWGIKDEEEPETDDEPVPPPAPEDRETM